MTAAGQPASYPENASAVHCASPVRHDAPR
jgi:hypothetical protein